MSDKTFAKKKAADLRRLADILEAADPALAEALSAHLAANQGAHINVDPPAAFAALAAVAEAQGGEVVFRDGYSTSRAIRVVTATWPGFEFMLQADAEAFALGVAA